MSELRYKSVWALKCSSLIPEMLMVTWLVKKLPDFKNTNVHYGACEPYTEPDNLMLPCEHPHRTHDLCSGSQDHHPSKSSVQKTICCNSTSNAPDDGRMYPKHVELKTHLNYLVASSWHSKLFHEPDKYCLEPHIPFS